jgi:hypothetical protein
MTKRLELYDWPKDHRTNAEEMYVIARTLLLEARRVRAEAPGARRNGAADASRRAAALILGRIRAGREYYEFHRRKLVREAVRRACVEGEEPKNLGGAIFNLHAIHASGLDRPEFEEKR